MPAQKKSYVLGFGNYDQSDDGIGLHIIEYMVEHKLDQGFEANEAGNDGLRLLTYFSTETDKIVIIDAALIGKMPGEYMIIDPAQIESQKVVSRITTHEGDVLKLIELGKKIGYPIPKIKILAIQPRSLELSIGLSEILHNNLSRYVQAAIKEVTS